MLFIPLALLSLISGIIWYKSRTGREIRLDILTLISSSGALMFLVDSLFLYMNGEPFIELTEDMYLLSVIVVSISIVIWLSVLLIEKMKSRFRCLK